MKGNYMTIKVKNFDEKSLQFNFGRDQFGYMGRGSAKLFAYILRFDWQSEIPAYSGHHGADAEVHRRVDYTWDPESEEMTLVLLSTKPWEKVVEIVLDDDERLRLAEQIENEIA